MERRRRGRWGAGLVESARSALSARTFSGGRVAQLESECRSWRSAADLLGPHADAPVAVIGAPLAERSLTPGRCDLAPGVVRAALKRMSVYDLETETDLSPVAVCDAGDVNLKVTSPVEAFEAVRVAVALQGARRDLNVLLGGNHAVTRPGVDGLDASLEKVGLLTL